MKKSLFSIIAVGLFLSAEAQNAPTKKLDFSKISKVAYKIKMPVGLSNADKYIQTLTNNQTHHKTSHSHRAQVSGAGIHCGGAENVNSIRYANLTQVTYNQELNLIVFTHRLDWTKVNGNVPLDGAYEASISKDFGNTWDTSLVLYWADSTRFPNGVIMNFAGNKTIDKAVWAVNGPATKYPTGISPPYNGWDSVAFGSVFFDSSHVTQSYLANGAKGVVIESNGEVEYMSTSSDSTVHSIGDGYRIDAAGNLTVYTGASLNTGKWNSTNNDFNWSQTKFQPRFISVDSVPYIYDSTAEFRLPSGTAWSLDGKTGYVVLFGNLDSAGYNYVSYQPIVYVTTNSGKSWKMLLHSFRNDTVMENYLYPTVDSSVLLPYWDIEGNYLGAEDDYDLTVDSLNNLHLIGAVQAAYSTNPDSAGYIYAMLPASARTIFDVTYNSNGFTGTRYIDSIHGLPWIIAGGGSEINNWTNDANGYVSFGARVQVSTNANRSKIFAIWLDDIQSGSDSIELPDIFGQGWSIKSKSIICGGVQQFTNTGLNFLLDVSDYAKESSDGADSIPCVIVETPGSPNDGTEPLNFLYLNNIAFCGVAGIPTIANNAITVSNYPNPFNKTTTLSINLKNSCKVSVDVYNIIGEKVLSISPQNMNSGNHLITINGASFDSGVYFCNVIADNQSTTLKMAVVK